MAPMTNATIARRVLFDPESEEACARNWDGRMLDTEEHFRSKGERSGLCRRAFGFLR
jgi:hypothetical protein